MASPFFGSNVLVTGATGFVGTHLTEELLSQRARVTVLVNDLNQNGLFYQRGLLHGVKAVVGSLSDFSLLRNIIRDNQIDTVIHLAAIATEGIAFQDPLLAFEVNIRGTYHLLEACREYRSQVRKIIVASSDKAYGSSLVLPYKEEHPLVGRHPYDVSKSCADLIAQAYFHSFALPIAVGRYGNIFGPGDLAFNRLIPGTLRRLYRGEAPIVKLHKDGVFTRDFLYIKDVVNSYTAMAAGLENPANHGEAFNFSLNGNWNVNQIVDLLRKITETERLSVKTVTAPHGEIQHQHVSNEKAKGRLEWRPEYKMEEALEETACWYFRHFEAEGEEKVHFAELRVVK